MALNNDSLPFAALQESAEEFKTTFDTNIAECLGTLNSKIVALISDPNSSSRFSGQQSSAHVEFSMAKYEILAQMKELFNEIETGWLNKLAEMKEEFIENIEVFLANTKLEVKLPILKSPPRAGVRKSPATAKSVQADKSPSTVSSIYPKLINTARQIPVLSSLIPIADDDEEEEYSEEEQIAPVTYTKPSGRTPKRVTINTAEQYIPSSGRNGTPLGRGNQLAPEVHNLEQESESEEEVVDVTPVKKYIRGRSSTANTPVSAKKAPVENVRRGRKSLRNQQAVEEVQIIDDMEVNESEEEVVTVPIKEPVRRGRKSIKNQPVIEEVSVSTPSRRGRPSKKTTAQQQIDSFPDAMEVIESEDELATAAQKTPKQVHFSLGLDVNEELDIYSPELEVSKPVSRRKTMVNQVKDNFPDISFTPEIARGKSKRKTVGGNLLDQSVAPSPKRLKKSSGRSSLAPSAMQHNETMESNLLESEGTSESGKYSSWIPLSDIGGNVPAQPGVYELKVAQAKKPAYIGGCESLRQKLTLHKLSHNSGHKHLDKFIERNGSNLLVRYEQLSSVAEAKNEEKIRVKSFVTSYKTTPAYN